MICGHFFIRNLTLCGLLPLIFSGGLLPAQSPTSSCTQCVEWNKPQAPFRIYGNTYYVGPHGLGSILITTEAGDMLIDGALQESAPVIAANVRALGFKMTDVKFILNSHVHYDHAAGIAELQRLSGATVVASKWSAAVLKSGKPDREDPQYDLLPAIQRVEHVQEIHDGESLHLGSLVMTAHATPGHTPGGTSWTWRSCENDTCLDMVYADSLSPVSAEGFKFSSSVTYPDVMQDFQKSYQFLRTTPCDILLTPHAEASNFWERVEAREKGVKPDPLIDANACRKLADDSSAKLQERVKAEAAH